MAYGPNRARLEQYFAGADESAVRTSATDWREQAGRLREVASALEAHATDPDVFGTDSLTGQRMVEEFKKSAASMRRKADLINGAVSALEETATAMERSRAVKDSAAMADLGPAPSAYRAPTHSPGYTPTEDQVRAEGQARARRNQAISNHNNAVADQEQRAATEMRKLDEAFLAAIPPMRAIHHQADPTEPQAPSGSGGRDGAAPSTSGSGRVSSTTSQSTAHGTAHATVHGTVHGAGSPGSAGHQSTATPGHTSAPTPTGGSGAVPLTSGLSVSDPGAVTNVAGASDSGATFAPAQSPPAGTSGSGASSVAPAVGAGLGAGLLGGGAIAGIRPGAASPSGGAARSGASARASSVRPIGATSRAAAGSTLGRGATAGSTTRGSAPRAGVAGASGGRGGAGAPRGAPGAGARTGAGAQAGSGSTAGRGTRGRRDDERTSQSDHLAFEQDWLDDEGATQGLLN